MTEDCPYAGVLRLSGGLSKKLGQRPGANPTEADVGGGEPRGGPEQEGARGADVKAKGRRGEGEADLADAADVHDPLCHAVGAAAPATTDGVRIRSHVLGPRR